MNVGFLVCGRARGLFEIIEWEPCMGLLNTDILASNAVRQWLLIAISHVEFYTMWKEAWVNL